MDHLLQLLPGEHISAFPGRFHRLGVFNDFNKSCIFLGVTNTVFKARRFLGKGQDKLYSRVNTDLHSAFGFDDSFKKLLTPFLIERETQTISDRSKLHKLKIIGEHSLEGEGWHWCSKCVTEDQENYGLAYYHHDHQIPGIFHCYKHNIRLSSVCAHCGLNAPTLKQLLLPPKNNLCPRCESYISPDDTYYDESMSDIERVITKLLAGQIQFTVHDIRHHICKHIGVNFIEHLNVHDNQRLNEWRKFISSYLTSEAKDAYFRKTNGGESGSRADALLCDSRLYRAKNATGILHPLVQLIALKAAGYEIFKSR